MSKQNLVLFHGTGQDISKFTEEGVGRGGDENAALGVHATACPDEAGEYARMSVEPDEDPESGRVLVLWYSYEKDASMFSSMDFFGIDQYGECEVDSDHFPAMRQRYLNDGFDVITVEFGEEPIFVMLKPEKIKILGSLTLEQAENLGERLRQNNVDRFDPESLYQEVQKVLRPHNHKFSELGVAG